MATQLDQTLLQNMAEQTIPLLSLEYPTLLIAHLRSANDPIPSHRALHPLFYGCYDWHSSVHSHWQLLRISHYLADSTTKANIHARLSESFDDIEGLATEADYLRRVPGFERPYGLAWLLYLCRELRLLEEEAIYAGWLENLSLLEQITISNLATWLPKLDFPVRGGLHSQTAFSLTLIWDWAVTAQRDDVLQIVRTCAEKWYANDRNAPIAYEPSASDFLSPTLATIDLMRRIREPASFMTWLDGYLPALTSPQATAWLTPVAVADEQDGRLAHFAGLNFSRAWVLKALSRHLPSTDNRQPTLREAAEAHMSAGMRYVISPAYMLSHWVPSFAIYALTEHLD